MYEYGIWKRDLDGLRKSCRRYGALAPAPEEGSILLS
jgi:hypothetical protein